MDKQSIKNKCTRFLSGHKHISPELQFQQMSEWCKKHKVSADHYGNGIFLQNFEEKIAKILGKEAAVFMPSGTMAQQIALRIWSEASRNNHVAMHSTSHVELHEHRGYEHLHNLRVSLLGSPLRVPNVSDIEQIPETLSTILLELPMREIGGMLPTWKDLQAMKSLCRKRSTKLHLDGARLWECRGFYANKTYAEICEGFDSVYVSFYKGIGGISGAALAGDRNFIEQSRIWLRRHGGNLFSLHPYYISAAMNLDARLDAMPKFLQRAKSLAKVLSKEKFIAIKPGIPHVNMFHLFVKGDSEALEKVHLQLASKSKLWISGYFHPAQVPGWCWFETYIGENALEISDREIINAMRSIDQMNRS